LASVSLGGTFQASAKHVTGHLIPFVVDGKSDGTLWTTLQEEDVIVHVKKSDRECEGTDNHSIHLTSPVHVGDNYGYEDNLNDGNLWEHETLLDGLYIFGRGWGVLFHSLAVDGHFYFMLRK
jgi:hypothetical protein